jgi:hypothetical protein
MPRGNTPGSPNTHHLKRTAGPGRPKGAKNKITRDWVEQHLRQRVDFDPVKALFSRLGKGPGAVWTVRELAALSAAERMCLESVDIVKGNVDQSDHSLETVIKVRWYAKDKPLEPCARSLGMLKDSMHLTVSEETLDRLDEWKAANLRARQLADTDDGDDPDIHRVN